MKRLIIAFVGLALLGAAQAHAEGSSEDNEDSQGYAYYEQSSEIGDPEQELSYDPEDNAELHSHDKRKQVSLDLISQHFNGNLDPLNVFSSSFPLPSSYNWKYNSWRDNYPNVLNDQYDVNPLYDLLLGNYKYLQQYYNEQWWNHYNQNEASTEGSPIDQTQSPPSQVQPNGYNVNIVYNLNLCRDDIKY